MDNNIGLEAYYFFLTMEVLDYLKIINNDIYFQSRLHY